jgi:hypothetical protein
MGGECAAYELVGGVFAKTGRADATMAGRPEQSEGPSLVARWLPTKDNDEDDDLVIERASVGVPARDFALDPSQDVLALVELPLVVLSFLARSPSIES